MAWHGMAGAMGTSSEPLRTSCSLLGSQGPRAALKQQPRGRCLLSACEPVSCSIAEPLVRRLVLQKLELAVSVDAVVSAVRAYLERSCRELFAKGPAGQSGLFEEQGEDSLAGQLSILGSWHTWLLGHLRHFKARQASEGSLDGPILRLSWGFACQCWD